MSFEWQGISLDTYGFITVHAAFYVLAGYVKLEFKPLHIVYFWIITYSYSKDYYAKS